MTKQRIGVKVGFSGNDSIDCDAGGVTCYGAAADGVTRIRGSRPYEGPGGAGSCTRRHRQRRGRDEGRRDPRLRPGLPRRAPRRGRRSSRTRRLRGRGVPRPRQRLLLHHVRRGEARGRDAGVPGHHRRHQRREHRQHPRRRADPERQRHQHRSHFTGSAPNKRWETTGTDRLPIELGAGTRRIDIEWSQRRNNSTLDMGGADPATCLSNQSNNPCKGTFTERPQGVQRRPAASPGRSRRCASTSAASRNVNNVPRCAAGQGCPHGGRGPRRARRAARDHAARRPAGGAAHLRQRARRSCRRSSSTASPASRGGHWIETTLRTLRLRARCTGSRTTTIRAPQGDAARKPQPAGRGSASPSSRAPERPGRRGSERAHPLRAAEPRGQLRRPFREGTRRRAPSPRPLCPNYPEGTRGSSALLPGALRVTGRIGSGGGDTVPIVNFAYFYVTGWHSKGGGFDNPCAAPGSAA